MANYTPHKVQADAHQAFLVDEVQYGTIFWGRRVGKTKWSANHLKLSALFKQGPYWAVFDTRQHAKDVLWEVLLGEIPPELIEKTDATELVITLKYFAGPVWVPGLGWQAVVHSTKKPPSTIRLSGSDYADRDRGGEAEGIIFDEYQDQEPDKWEAVYEPFLATTEGWACFMGTARGYNHWYDLMEFAKKDENTDWFYSEATWRDNPLISPEWIKKSRERAEKRGKLDIWLQEYELAFMTPQKSVYPMFSRKLHIKKPSDVPEEGTVYGVWDFGYAEGHPMAFNLVLIDKMGKWWVFDEIHGTEMNMDDTIEQIRTKIGERFVTGIVADSARPDLIEYARSKGLNIIAAPKREGSIVSGIGLLRQRMTPKSQVLGDPAPDLYVTQNCRNTVVQFEMYQYKETKEGRPASELPIKRHDDHPDALRYLALYLKYGLTKKKKMPDTKLKTNQYGLIRT